MVRVSTRNHASTIYQLDDGRAQTPPNGREAEGRGAHQRDDPSRSPTRRAVPMARPSRSVGRNRARKGWLL